MLAEPRTTPRVTLATASRYQLNQLRYEQDPVGWVKAFVRFPPGEELAPYQEDILRGLVRHSRATVRAPHGSGKSGLSALAILWFATTRDGMDWKAVTTASLWRQLTKYLWPEVHKWVRHIDWDKLGMQRPRENRELLALSLKLGTGEAFAVASDQPWGIEGAHADHLLYLFDESKAIPAATWDAAEGAFSGAGSDTGREALALAVSTPGVGPSRFRDIHERKPGYDDWWVRRVTLEEAVAAGRVSREWAEQRREQWGEGSLMYTTRVLGEFADQDEAGVIPIEWIQAAIERWEQRRDAGELDLAPTIVSVDVADGGADDSIIARIAGPNVLGLETVRQEKAGETMRVAGRVKALADAHGAASVVDSIGVGAGVVSRLREQGVQVTAFNASERSTATDRSREIQFLNLRAEAWWMMREALDPEHGDGLALPPDDLLVGELAAPRWDLTSSGRVKVESKDDVRKRLGRSTDRADPVVMGFWLQRRRPPGKLKLAPAWGGR